MTDGSILTFNTLQAYACVISCLNLNNNQLNYCNTRKLLNTSNGNKIHLCHHFINEMHISHLTHLKVNFIDLFYFKYVVDSRYLLVLSGIANKLMISIGRTLLVQY